ncbi:MAG: LysE family transporter [Mycobacterium sp.]
MTVRDASSTTSDQIAMRAERWYLRGALVSMTSPKIMLFYLAVFPQFLGDAHNTIAHHGRALS